MLLAERRWGACRGPLLLGAALAAAWPEPAAFAGEPEAPKVRDANGAPSASPTAEAAGAPSSDTPSPSPEPSPGQSGRAATDDAESATPACSAAFKRAQRLRRRGELLSARAELVICGQPGCPDAIEAKCVAWVEEVRGAVPTIVVAGQDELGHDLAKADVLVDGEPMATSLDGLPIELDPGPHDVAVLAAGRRTSTRIVAVQGVKNRVVTLRFEPPRPVAPAGSSLQLPVMSWVGFGLGAVGVVVGTVTGVAALFAAQELDCPGDVCFQYQSDALGTGLALAHTSTASFALAGAGTALGVVGLWVAKRPPAVSEVAVRPLLGAGVVGLEGAF